MAKLKVSPLNCHISVIAGPSQPDEDDYGFVSETSSALYNKLIQKMYNTPSDDLPKFAPSKKPTSGNLSNTKVTITCHFSLVYRDVGRV